ncbi:starch-binding protein [Clostridium butyricum]
MKGKKLRNIISAAIVCASVLTLTPVEASIGKTGNGTEKPFSWDNATVYFALTDRFNNGDSSNDYSYGRGLDQNGKVQDGYKGNPGAFQGGDLKGLTEKIEEGYFDDLGVNAIWITAPYEQIHGFTSGNDAGGNATSNGKGFPYYSYHGYWALDYSNIDANMGTKDDLKNFVDTAHAHGIRVVMDIVLNHVGYTTMKDADEYGFGGLKDGWKDYYYGPLTNLVGGGTEDTTYYDKTSPNWKNNWWGSDFVRSSAGYDGYPQTPQGDGWTSSLCGLPDVKTESTKEVELPPLLENKWKAEGRYDEEMASLNKFFSERNLPKTPRNYIIKWLTDYIRDYGIDGFRCDTANQVDLDSWAALNKEARVAFDEYKEKNQDKVLDENAEFWTVGESWGHGVKKDAFFTEGGFSAMINFGFKGANISNLKGIYDNLSSVNNDDDFNVLSYISSHDDSLYDRKSLRDGGTALLLAPGAVQIFYGDESGRPLKWTDRFTSDYKDQCFRSFMNWDDINNPNSDAAKTLEHWQKVGDFRNNHLAVGAGQNITLNESPYTFGRVYSKNGIMDKVVCVVGASGETSVNVNGVFNDGAKVKDAYTGNVSVVKDGKVNFKADENGVILIEKGDNAPDVSISKISCEYYSDTLDLTLSVSGADTGSYSIDGKETVKFKNGDVITIGKDTSYDVKTTVSVYASNSDGEASQTYTYTKRNPNFTTKVYVQKPDSWSGLNAYVYNKDGSTTNEVKAWPGVPMTKESDGLYSYSLPTGFRDAKIILNDGKHQDPGVGQDGYSLKNGSKMLYENGVWSEYVESDKPQASVSKENCEFKDSLTLTLGSKNGTKSTYSINDSNEVEYKDGDKITIGQDAKPGDTIKVTLKVSDGTDTDVKSYTYTKAAEVAESKIYCKIPNGWSNVKAYIYNENVTPKKELASWPGVAMTKESDGLYSYTLKDWEEDAYVIFTDGKNQTPAVGQKGFKLTNGSNMIYDNGSWSKYEEKINPCASISKEDCEFDDSLTLTLGSKNGTKSTYSINGSEEIEYKDGDKITIGENAQPGDSIKVTLKVSNGTNTDVKNYTYTKAAKIAESKIYCKAPDGWSSVKVYIYNEDVSPKKELASWPGVTMTKESNGLYSYTLKDWEQDAYVIFTDGKNQNPGVGQKGFKLTNGNKMIYENGSWTQYNN